MRISEDHGYIGPIEWFSVEGGRIYIMAPGITFAPDRVRLTKAARSQL